MIGDILQPTHLLLILVVALLVLGPKRLPEVGRSLGKGIRDFRGALTGDDNDEPRISEQAHEYAPAPPVSTVQAPAPAAPAVVADAPAPSAQNAPAHAPFAPAETAAPAPQPAAAPQPHPDAAPAASNGAAEAHAPDAEAVHPTSVENPPVDPTANGDTLAHPAEQRVG